MRKILASALCLAIGYFAAVHGQAPGAVNWANIHTATLAADFTSANASGLQTIPGLTLTLQAGGAASYQIDCDLGYSQATVVADGLGIQFTGVAPTNALIGGIAATNATAYASGTPATITNTTAATVVTMTPAVTTVLYAHMGGSVTIPNNGQDTVVNIMVSQSTAANVVVIKRNSVCRASAMP